MKSLGIKGRVLLGMFAIGMMVCIFSCLGCQSTKNGQTLPNPNYLKDDIQYHPSGTEFQYQEEVDYMNKAQAEREMVRQGNGNF